MVEIPGDEAPHPKTRVVAVVTLLLAVILPFIIFDSPLIARVTAVAVVCLGLWLFELVPAFVPTLLLWVLIPLTLSAVDPQYSLATVLRWAADPVLALFFGGFALGVAAERHGVSGMLAEWAVRRSRNRFALLLALTMALSALMSMWISNIAAAALMFGAIRPILGRLGAEHPHRRSLLIGTAFAANLGGMATPVGTGPNAIAIASVSNRVQIDFVDWMVFAAPLTLGLLVLAFVLIWWRGHGSGNTFAGSGSDVPLPGASVGRSGRIVFLSILAGCITLWLSEPFHGIPAAVIALAAAALIFLVRNLRGKDLARIDWSTLLLIAGGITLGRMLEASGLVGMASARLNLAELNPGLLIFILCLASAFLSALMSNTATVVMLIPLATALSPEPSTAILVAIAASFGMTFVISTPQNAMAHGEGGVHGSDFFYPGLVIMLVGCGVVALTGRAVMNLMGIP
jgi:sodium-dependent dicarboxylate transporter 2/3/5